MALNAARGTLRTVLFCLAAAGNSAAVAAAEQVISGVERLESDRPEAWAMNYFTSVTLFGGLGVPHARRPGELELGLELGSIPQLSASEMRVGFNGTKDEDLNHSPILARPRLTVGLPWKFALSLSYVPPLEVFGVEPELFTLALERPLLTRGPWRAGLRLYGQVGEVEGAFTCSAEVARHAPGSAGNPFGCEAKSHDQAAQRYAGVELSSGYRIEAWRGLTPYVAVLGNYLDTHVDVNARTFGFIDRTRLEAETWTYALMAGLSLPWNERTTLSIAAFYSPLEVVRPPATAQSNDALVNVRALLSYRFP